MQKELMVTFNQERNQWELVHHCWINDAMIESARIKAYNSLKSRIIPPQADVERKKIFRERLEKLAKPGSLKLVINDHNRGVDIFKSTQGTGKIISLPKHI